MRGFPTAPCLALLYKFREKYGCVPNVDFHILHLVVCKQKMAEEDIAYLLSRGELAEPLETEQSEINRLVDKSKVKDFIDQQKKKSMVNCTKRDLNIVYKWLFPKMN